MTSSRHVAIVGGGIAGTSAAYSLAKTGAFDRVTLLEAEAQLAQHTTGRSAALLTENYGAGPIRPLTTASLGFLHDPPDTLVDAPLLEKRGIMTVSTSAEGHVHLDEQLEEGRTATNPIVEIDVDQAGDLAPHIRFAPGYRVMWEEESYDIDVAALQQAFVRGMRSHGGEIATSHRVDSVRPEGDGWTLETTGGSVHADVVVNASGAWGDVVARGAGIAPVGLQPMRRTAFMVKSPFDDSSRYPFVADSFHSWYLRPDGTQFMCSPADEIPSEPCDAKAEEIDIAYTIDLLNEHTTLGIRSITSSWAGLRTFGPDRSMVIGPEPEHPMFIWCVGQGGTGIQTAPGVAQLIADLATDGAPGPTFADTGLDLERLLPDRIRS